MNSARQLTFDLAHRPSLSGEDFLIAPANSEAVAWVDKWPDWPANSTPNALAISGPSGSGKTHLAHVFMAKTNAYMIEADAIESIDARHIIERNNAIVIDNADCIAGSIREEALFHILNMLKEMGHYALICSINPPSKWNVQLPDLKSRLSAMQHVPIQDPDETLLSAVMVKQFSDRQLRIDSAALDYILPRMERSFRAVNDIVSNIDKLALQEHRNITIPLIKRVLDNYDQNEMEI